MCSICSIENRLEDIEEELSFLHPANEETSEEYAELAEESFSLRKELKNISG